MNVTAKSELMKIAKQAVELAENGYISQLKADGIVVEDYRLAFDAYKEFAGTVSLGDVRLSLFPQKTLLEMPFQMGEENLPAVVVEFQEKIDSLIARLPEIDQRRKELLRMSLEEQLQSL